MAALVLSTPSPQALAADTARLAAERQALLGEIRDVSERLVVESKGLERSCIAKLDPRLSAVVVADYVALLRKLAGRLKAWADRARKADSSARMMAARMEAESREVASLVSRLESEATGIAASTGSRCRELFWRLGDNSADIYGYADKALAASPGGTKTTVTVTTGTVDVLTGVLTATFRIPAAFAPIDLTAPALTAVFVRPAGFSAIDITTGLLTMTGANP